MWQKRLSDSFINDNKIGGLLPDLMKIERASGMAFIEKFVGFRHLSDASQSFFLATIILVDESGISELGKILKNFPFMFVKFIMIFRRVRAASELSLCGYFGSAYALLREVKDRTIHLSAVFQGIASYADLMGISSSDPAEGTVGELKNVRRRKRNPGYLRTKFPIFRSGPNYSIGKYTDHLCHRHQRDWTGFKEKRHCH